MRESITPHNLKKPEDLEETQRMPRPRLVVDNTRLGDTIEVPIPKAESREKLRLNYAGRSLVHEGHPDRNEDAMLFDEENRTFGVFDGMGGHDGGDIASRTAEEYFSAHAGELKDGGNIKFAEQALKHMMMGAHQAVLERRIKTEGSKMGTTATVLKFYTDEEGKTWALIASVGDSRVYRAEEDGTLSQLSEDDDTLVKFFPNPEERMLVAKKIANATSTDGFSDLELAAFKNRNVISAALGERIENLKIISVPAERGDRFLLTSDGVHDNLTTDKISETVRTSGSPENIARNLINKSREHSRTGQFRAKPDDMSAVFVEIE